MATSGILIYRDKYFKKIDGATMGSPLGSTIENFCMGYFESKLLEEKM